MDSDRLPQGRLGRASKFLLALALLVIVGVLVAVPLYLKHAWDSNLAFSASDEYASEVAQWERELNERYENSMELSVDPAGGMLATKLSIDGVHQPTCWPAWASYDGPIHIECNGDPLAMPELVETDEHTRDSVRKWAAAADEVALEAEEHYQNSIEVVRDSISPHYEEYVRVDGRTYPHCSTGKEADSGPVFIECTGDVLEAPPLRLR